MQKSKFFTTVTAAALVLGSPAAQAQIFDGPIGYAGIELNYGNETDNRSPDSSLDYMAYGFEGQYGYPIFGRGLLGAEISYDILNWDEGQANFDTDVPNRDFNLSFHYTHAVSDPFRVSAFAGYTRTGLVTDDLQKEPYETAYGGIGAQYFVGDTFMLFGQFTFANTFSTPPDQSVTDPEGVNDAMFQRVGVTWFPTDVTGITFTYEAGQVGDYLDGGIDSVDVQSLQLSGESMLPTDRPLAVTYNVRRDQYDLSAGGISATDLSMGIGVRMLFGADTPRESWQDGRFLGAPSLPSRTANWLEVMD